MWCFFCFINAHFLVIHLQKSCSHCGSYVCVCHHQSVVNETKIIFMCAFRCCRMVVVVVVFITHAAHHIILHRFHRHCNWIVTVVSRLMCFRFVFRRLPKFITNALEICFPHSLPLPHPPPNFILCHSNRMQSKNSSIITTFDISPPSLIWADLSVRSGELCSFPQSNSNQKQPQNSLFFSYPCGKKWGHKLGHKFNSIWFRLLLLFVSRLFSFILISVLICLFLCCCRCLPLFFFFFVVVVHLSLFFYFFVLFCFLL